MHGSYSYPVALVGGFLQQRLPILLLGPLLIQDKVTGCSGKIFKLHLGDVVNVNYITIIANKFKLIGIIDTPIPPP